MAGFVSDEASKVGMKQCMLWIQTTNTVPICVLCIFSEVGISVIAMDGKEDNVNRNPKILHVTAASSYKTNSSKETIKFLTNTFVNRKRSDRDIWLFGLDFSPQDHLQTEIV